MQVTSTSNCFVCGSDNDTGLGAIFTTDRELDTSFCSLKIDTRFQGWQDVVHGGVIAALLDEACIYAALGLGKQLVTADLAVRYKKPLPVDQEVSVIGEVVEKRRKILRIKAKIMVGDEIYAEADSRVFILS